MKFKSFKKAILVPIEQLQKECGEEFLELMVETIVLQDDTAKEIGRLNGWEYNLSRSRHWDKDQNIYIMFDGFSNEHLEELFADIDDLGMMPARMILIVDGMNDLDEPIHKELIVELSDIND